MNDNTTATEESAQKFAAGRRVMTQVYGQDLTGPLKSGDSPWLDETIGHLFKDIWSRPGLSIRDRRLLIIGATAMLGRADLIEVQVYGALAGGELDAAQLDEALLQLSFYIGWPNATAVSRGIQSAVQRHRASTA